VLKHQCWVAFLTRHRPEKQGDGYILWIDNLQITFSLSQTYQYKIDNPLEHAKQGRCADGDLAHPQSYWT
jgi:hypothetical protein